MSKNLSTSERVINVKDIDLRHRHTIIFQLSTILNRTAPCNWLSTTTPGPCASSSEQSTALGANGPTLKKVKKFGGCGFGTPGRGYQPCLSDRSSSAQKQDLSVGSNRWQEAASPKIQPGCRAPSDWK